MSDEWISAVEALKLVAAISDDYSAPRAICSRAHAGLIRARAARYVMGEVARDNVDIPRDFWWAQGEAALEQNWSTGDFETWIDQRMHRRAFGVHFLRADIDAMIGPAVANRDALSNPPVQPGGRPAAAWWDDLWIEVIRQLWHGELKPERQSDIEAAIMNWAAMKGINPGVSTIRPRARKLWAALNKEDEN